MPEVEGRIVREGGDGQWIGSNMIRPSLQVEAGLPGSAAGGAASP